MVSIRSDCRTDEDREESNAWFASQCLERTILKSHKLSKNMGNIFLPVPGMENETERTGDKNTLKWCLSLIHQVKFWEYFPPSFIKNRK